MNAPKNRNLQFRVLIGLFIGIVLFSSCGDDEKIPDVSNVQTEFEFFNFDSAFYHTDSAAIPVFYTFMEEEHPAFLKSYMKVLLAPSSRNIDTLDFLKAMRSHPTLIRLHDTTQMILGDLSKEKKAFAQAMKYAKHYFPKKTTPKFYTYISEFGRPALIDIDEDGRDVIGIGLDFFLGSNFPGYDPMTFPSYIKRSMTPAHIVSKTLETYADDLAGGVQGDQFLDYIITNGKSIYILDHLLPTTPDSILLEYTAAQMQRCEDNQFNMWSHFIHEELLYSTQMADFRKLINPSPNATGMPEEAPGRTGNYMGWQIIKAYMKRHPKTTFQQLVDLKDSKLLLKKSKYKPKAK